MVSECFFLELIIDMMANGKKDTNKVKALITIKTVTNMKDGLSKI